MQINPNEVNKDNFIKRLSSMTVDEINQLIREKGKKPKLVKPLIKLNN